MGPAESGSHMLSCFLSKGVFWCLLVYYGIARCAFRYATGLLGVCAGDWRWVVG
jgi:hypothetical protein